jgi:prepilin-type N-terminal cleavage/methylation domain-containing protein
MYINFSRRQAFTLVEIMVAVGLAAIVSLAVLLLAFYSQNSFVVIANYVKLSEQNHLALDKMSKDIRQAHSVTAYATNSISFLDVSSNALTYTFDPSAKTLVRIGGGVTTTYLTNCDSLNFWIYQHTVISNTYDCYLPAYVTNARLVEVSWSCSIYIPSMNDTIVDSGQSAQIALRNH